MDGGLRDALGDQFVEVDEAVRDAAAWRKLWNVPTSLAGGAVTLTVAP
jgi:hypothetical protein